MSCMSSRLLAVASPLFCLAICLSWRVVPCWASALMASYSSSFAACATESFQPGPSVTTTLYLRSWLDLAFPIRWTC
jgi:hypothetical protein